MYYYICTVYIVLYRVRMFVGIIYYIVQIPMEYVHVYVLQHNKMLDIILL